MIKHKINYKLIEKNADILTPVGIFKRLEGKKKFLLESSFQHETKGKYSYIGANPYQEIIGYENQTKVIDLITNEEKLVSQNVIDYLKENLPKVECELPLPFTGGAIGYVAYDAIRKFVSVVEELRDELNIPDYHFMMYHTIIIYEHRTEKAHILTINLDDSTEKELEERLQQISKQLDQQITIPDPETNQVTFKAQISKEKFIKNVK